jgi:hypothetical protein
MGNFMNIFRRLFKPRQHKRFIVQSGTFVIISSSKDREQKVQLVDISHGGMAFIYQGSPSELETSGILKLLTEKPYGGKIDFDTVSDIPAPGSTQTSEPFRRRGVKFKWMGAFDDVELKKFIREVSLGEK